jgi:tRNA (guanine-N7-)-methyltransferase
MKPKDLKAVFTWEDRKPLLKDGVQYVPDYYFRHEEYVMPEFHMIFQNNNPVYLEYCSGNGDWIINKAKENPTTNWIAVEKQFDRVRKIWSKSRNLDLKNLLIVCGEAYTFSKYYVKNNSISGGYINFPDPWPKDKHAKNRLIKPAFLDELSRILTSQSLLTFVTDDLDYTNEVIKIFLNHELFSSVHPKPYYLKNLENYGYSYFHELWKNLSRTIHHMSFINNKRELLCL